LLYYYEVTVTFSSESRLASPGFAAFGPNIAYPYLGVIFINEGKTREERKKNERRTREDFSQNDPFQAFLTPDMGAALSISQKLSGTAGPCKAILEQSRSSVEAEL
jgi:hypothetical protein